jgi:DNA-binding transcriptional LysR family regulator
MDRITELDAFVRTVDLGSQTAAAEALGLTRMAVSRLIQGLERRLGIALLERSTRRQILTAAGTTYLREARRVLAQYQAFVGEEWAPPRDRLRISAPMSFGFRCLVPLLAQFSGAHPTVEHELILNDRLVNLTDEGFDVAIRISNHIEPHLHVRRLTRSRTVICGAPAYLAAHGVPATPDDLRRHACLRYAYAEHGRDWVLRDAAHGVHRVPVAGPLACNNGDALVAAAIAGAGLILQPHFIVQEALTRGDLVPVLTDFSTKTFTIQAVHTATAAASPATALVEFLAAACRDADF